MEWLTLIMFAKRNRKVLLSVVATIAVVAGLIFGYITWANHQQKIGEDRATARYNQAIDKQKKAAAETLAKETARALAAERTLQDLKNRQEVQDAKNQKERERLAARLRDLADGNGRLRDPNAGRGECGGGADGADPATAGNRPGHGTETGGLLSADLSGLLRRLQREADEINDAYASCRADAMAVRGSADGRF